MNGLRRLLTKRGDLERVVGRNVSTSVKVHGLFEPANAFESRLNKFTGSWYYSLKLRATKFSFYDFRRHSLSRQQVYHPYGASIEVR